MCNSATTRGIAKNKNNQNLVASRNGLFAAAAATKKPRIRQSLVRRMMIINLCDFSNFVPLPAAADCVCSTASLPGALVWGLSLSLLLTDWDLFAQWLDFFRAFDAASYLTFLLVIFWMEFIAEDSHNVQQQQEKRKSVRQMQRKNKKSCRNNNRNRKKKTRISCSRLRTKCFVLSNSITNKHVKKR